MNSAMSDGGFRIADSPIAQSIRNQSAVRSPKSAFRAVALFLMLAVPLGAADNAREIVAESQKRTDAKSQRYEGLLQVFDSKGKISDKRWTFERLGAHGQSKSVLRFIAPAEVKGVALLVVNHPDRASDQWMWTPAIERDRRIALQDRSTRFFGTDFSFEDLEERDVDQFDYSLVGDDAVDGSACWQIRVDAETDRSRRNIRNRGSGFARTTTRSPESRTSSRTRSFVVSPTPTFATFRASGPRVSSKWPISAVAAGRA